MGVREHDRDEVVERADVGRAKTLSTCFELGHAQFRLQWYRRYGL